jgi:glycosyltransferase involved in cell wall biosynthesis
MRVALSTIGKFHTFDLARELHAHGALRAVYTGYPRFKLRSERLPPELIHTFPWVHAPLMGFHYARFLGTRFNRLLSYVDRISLDRYVSSQVPECDVFVGLSGSALRSGTRAQARGAKYVCDRGSSHIRVQDRLLREEHDLWGLRYDGIDPRVMELEENEYAAADCITVPSKFSLRSFQESGVPPSKLRRLPYGVDLSRFEPRGAPDPARFDILFVGGMALRKGVPYLIQAYRKLRHPAKSLTFVGSASPELIAALRARGQWADDARIAGPVPQTALKDIMSRSHVLVLPSIEDGFGMVLAQAMACGCPVIGSLNTGTEDLLTAQGQEGFTVPIRDSDAIAERLQQMADDPALRMRMGESAIARVKRLGGWRDYGNEAMAIYEALV